MGKLKYFVLRSPLDKPLSVASLSAAGVLALLLSIVMVVGTSCRSIARSKNRRAAASSRQAVSK